MDSFSPWIYANTSTLTCDFEIPPSLVDLATTTSITPDLEIFQGILPVEDFREF